MFLFLSNHRHASMPAVQPAAPQTGYRAVVVSIVIAGAPVTPLKKPHHRASPSIPVGSVTALVRVWSRATMQAEISAKL